MKKLSQTTIKRYSGEQLAKHLGRLDSPLYRVEPNGQVWKLTESTPFGNYYGFHCSAYDKDAVLACIEDVYFHNSTKG